MAGNARKIQMSKTFRRFVLSFLAVLIFPVICFTFLFQQNFRGIYKAQLVNQAETSVSAVGGELDRNLEALHSWVDYTVLSGTFEKEVRRKDAGAGEVREMLRAGLANYPLLENIGYYCDTVPNKVYTIEGTYLLEYYTQLCTGQESVEEFLEQLENINWSGWVSWKRGLQYIIKDPEGDWWIFQISQAKLSEILETDGAVTGLLDSQGNYLYGEEESVEEGYYRVVCDSERETFQVVRTLKEEVLFSELNLWQRNFSIMVVVILLLGGSMVLALTFYNEHPMKELLRFIRGRVQNIPAEMGGMEAIRFAMKSLEEQNVLLEAKQKRNQLLLRLVYGKDCELPQYQDALKEAGIFEKAECYRVILITSPEKREVDGSKIALYLDMIQTPECEFRQVNFMDQKSVVVIAGMTLEAEPMLEQVLQQMMEQLLENVDEPLCFFVGGRYPEQKFIHLSYSQAFASWQKEDVHASKNIVFYKSIRRRGGKFTYPKAELAELYTNLLEANVSGVVALTDMLLTVLKEQENNQFVCNALYYDLINTYYRAIQNLEMNVDGELLETEQLVIEQNSDTAGVIMQVMEQYLKFVEGSRTVSEPENDREWIIRVKEYIDENSQSAELNVSMVADYFGLTISNMSHKFKEQTNRNISDYIVEVRFAYACKLLKETGYSVKDIAAMLGYGKPYSFIRMFKQRFGMTPVEYRNQGRVDLEES